MKIRQLFLNRIAGRDWRTRAILGLTAAFLAGVPAFAGAPGPGPAAAAGDDETVGTLPILGPEWDVFGAFEARDRRPSVYLEGFAIDIASAVVDGYGTGGVSVEVLDPATQYVRVLFHGDLTFVLDRALVQDARLTMGVFVPRLYGSGVGAVRLGDRSSGAFTVLPGATSLQLHRWLDGGALDAHTLSFAARGRVNGSRYLLDVNATPEFLTIGQTN